MPADRQCPGGGDGDDGRCNGRPLLAETPCGIDRRSGQVKTADVCGVCGGGVGTLVGCNGGGGLAGPLALVLWSVVVNGMLVW